MESFRIEEHNSFFQQVKQMKLKMGRWNVWDCTDDSRKRCQEQFVRQLIVVPRLGRSNAIISIYFSRQYWAPTMCLNVPASEDAEINEHSHAWCQEGCNLVYLCPIQNFKTENIIVRLAGWECSLMDERVSILLEIIGLHKYKFSACKLVLRWLRRPVRVLKGDTGVDVPGKGPERPKHRVFKLKTWV